MDSGSGSLSGSLWAHGWSNPWDMPGTTVPGRPGSATPDSFRHCDIYCEVKPEVLLFLRTSRDITTGQTLTPPEITLRTFHLCGIIIIVCLRMVKVSFNSALGRKDVKKDAEILLPEDEVSRKWLS